MCNTGCKAEMGPGPMGPVGLRPKGPKGCVLGGIKFRGLHQVLRFAEGPKVANARSQASPCTAPVMDGAAVGSAMPLNQLGTGCQTAQPPWPKVHIR
jgi:hypothetical protein